MADEDKLATLFAALDAQDQQTLLAFAEFLRARAPQRPATPTSVPQPEPIPRPAQESVVAAIKRLSRSYHMLDKGEVLHQTSALMAEHIMQGKEAQTVIDELEAVFERRYQKLIGKDDQPA